ncbi:MAG: class I SAM-dependent methyltransferase [Vicinamibacteria bacterium]|nr:class I SAM-dependent methyltransferase [Vicinamibacteria bacterium]
MLEQELARRRTLQATGPRFRALWRIVRSLAPREMRLCFEGCPFLEGQMWFAERRLLVRTLRAHKPRSCAEVGTWKGGGSTFFTALALHQNGAGMLHTWEVDATLSAAARHAFEHRLPELAPHVAFHVGDYRAGSCPDSLDCVMLDGPEDADSTLEQLRFFEPRMGAGSLLFAHDWHTEKARLIRPLIEGGSGFEIVARVDPPVSVGFIVARRTGR